MVVVGWDAALANNGLVTIIDNNGVLTVADAGIIVTKKNKSQGTFGNIDYINRAFEIGEELKRYIIDANADLLIAEVPTTGTQSKVAAMAFGIVYGMIGGGLMTDQQLSNTPIILSQPVFTKIKLCDAKNASKAKIEEVVKKLLPNIIEHVGVAKKSQHEHIYDAAGVVLANLNDPIYKAVKNIER